MCCIERVRNIIVRLKREIKGQIAPNQISELGYNDYRQVAEFIYDGLPANSTADFKYFIDLKNVIYKEEYRQYYNKYNNIITQDERAMLLEQRQFIPSVQTDLVKIQYSLSIEVDHGFSSIISGNKIPDLIYPITIYSQFAPRDITKDQMVVMMPPIVIQETVLQQPEIIIQ